MTHTAGCHDCDWTTTGTWDHVEHAAEAHTRSTGHGTWTAHRVVTS